MNISDKIKISEIGENLDEKIVDALFDELDEDNSLLKKNNYSLIKKFMDLKYDTNTNNQKIKDKKKKEILKKKEIKKRNGINSEIFNLDIINYILNKQKKSSNDILIIKEFLSSMNFLSTLKGTFNSDKLLYSLSNYLKIEKTNSNLFIF